jgi:alkylhydroperoxidase/carboxymuconolactone decarboxylase family protein YurZ
MPDPYITEAGARAATEMFGEAGRQRAEENAERWVTRVDESWARILTGFVINGMYARDVLPTSTRELCAVAALAALGRADELEAHIRIALHSNPAEHVREVILQMAVYSGVPAALEGMRLFERVMAEES